MAPPGLKQMFLSIACICMRQWFGECGSVRILSRSNENDIEACFWCRRLLNPVMVWGVAILQALPSRSSNVLWNVQSFVLDIRMI